MEESKTLADYRGLIARAVNRDAEAIAKLRRVLHMVADNAPETSLTKISRFIADEIYPDADREAVEGN